MPMQAAQEEATSLRKAKQDLSQAHKAHAVTQQQLKAAQADLAEAQNGSAAELDRHKKAEARASSATEQAQQELDKVIGALFTIAWCCPA